MQQSAPAQVAVPGLTDHHAHLLRDAAGVGFPADTQAVRTFHERVARAGSTPMDVLDPPPSEPGLPGRLVAGLARAAAAGLVEITEMGMRGWAYLEALTSAAAVAPLPVRVRIYVASGLAEDSGPADLDARRADCGPWLRLDGVKFYADGWLGPRTCAMGEDFTDTGERGLLFADAASLARRIRPLAGRGWRIATHAIGDRAVRTVLDAYDLAWDHDPAAMAAAAPRIEHASVLPADLISRMAASGVVAGIQPSFAVTDAGILRPALGPARAAAAYPWSALAAAGVPMLAGTDYPIEVLDPLVGLARLAVGRSRRPGFTGADVAPAQALLPIAAAFAAMSDGAAGQTLLTADPRTVPPDGIDQIEVLGTSPIPFSS
jgi:predicted amidohydrolase YtcJ